MRYQTIFSTQTQIIITWLFLMFLLFGCKKEIRFPEDPKYSRLTPAERLQGLWRSTEYTFNEESIAHLFLPRIDPTGFFLSCVLNKPDPPSIMVKGLNFGEVSCRLEPEFLVIPPVRTDTSFIKGFYSPLQYDPRRFNHLAVWKITKLYGDDLNIIFETDTGTFKIFFNRIGK